MVTLFYLGLAIVAVGALWTLLIAFRTEWVWALVVLVFMPVAGFAFAILHWKDAKNPFLLQMAGCVLVIIAMKAHPELKVPWPPWRW
jgi:hypothetical protein